MPWAVLSRLFRLVSKFRPILRLALSRQTDRLVRVVGTALTLADQRGHQSLGSAHLLYGLAVSRSPFFDRIGLNLSDHAAAIAEWTGPIIPHSQPPEIGVDPQALTLLADAREVARACRVPYVGAEHLLMAFLRRHHDPLASYLARQGVDAEVIWGILKNGAYP